MSGPYSHAGVTVGVCTDPQDEDLTSADFQSLAYVNIGGVGSLGEYGVVTEWLHYVLEDSRLASKMKGMTDAGNPELEVARDDSDAGQAVMRLVGDYTFESSVALCVTKQDGSRDFLRGLVFGPISVGGGPEDFDLDKYVIALQQIPIHVTPISGDWILATGFWNDSGVWIDDAVWID